MPSTSAKQARTMAAAAHNPEFAKKVGIPQGVAREFNDADAGKRNKARARKLRSRTGSISSEGSAVGSASA